MMNPIETDDLTIRFDGKRCIHARRCVLGLPGVFKADANPWIQPGSAATEDIVRVIESCPSGALSYERKDGSGEAVPAVNTARVWENGPLELRGDIRVGDEAPQSRMLLCRCGRTANPPYCDNSHRNGFVATGLPGFNEAKDKDLEERGGPVEISVTENASCTVKGNIEVIAADGSRIARTKKAWFCRCGASGSKPFCDSSHNKIGFTKPAKADAG